MSNKLGQGKVIRGMYHHNNIVDLAVEYANGKSLSPEAIETLFNYRKKFDPLPDLSPFAWANYLIASEYTARALNLHW